MVSYAFPVLGGGERVSFYGKNYAIGCPFPITIMRQGITIDENIMRQGIMWKDAF